jgi:hypothetical protein
MWEGQHYSAPHGTPDFDQGDCLLDILNARVANFLGAPVTMTLGRQEIMLGDGWLVRDGTPLDGPRTYFFDAARFTCEFKNLRTTADLIYIDQTSDGQRWVEFLHDSHKPLIEQDERGLILWAANRSVKNTEINGYYIYKDMERVLKNGDDGFIHTFGGRVTAGRGEHWRYSLEGAHQFGERNGRSLRAFGANSRLSYLFNDALRNQLRADYEFLSGDDPSSGTDETFVPLWGRWTRLSDILNKTWALETRVREITNMHRLAMGWTCNPTEKSEVSADYHLLWADENTFAHGKKAAGFSDNGAFRGQLLAVICRYTFTKHLKGYIRTEFFFPGNYYTDFRNDVATFLRGELFFTW